MIYALTNSKGGVGKSTLSVHLAVWLKDQGANVALVDSDVQGSSSVWLHEVDPDMRILRLQTPDDVLDQIALSRRGLEKRFRKAVGVGEPRDVARLQVAEAAVIQNRDRGHTGSLIPAPPAGWWPARPGARGLPAALARALAPARQPARRAGSGCA